MSEICKCKYKSISKDINPIRCIACGLRFKKKKGKSDVNDVENLAKRYKKQRKSRKK